MAHPALQFDGVSMRFGEPGYTALDQLNLHAGAGTFTAVVGPSGCGKSTLLNLGAGLLQPTSGSIRVFGEELLGLNKRAAYVFQQDALLPWKTVLANVALGLELRGRTAADAREESRVWLRRVGLQEFAGAYPSQLSGGMRKRAAMAQSWIVNPDILLMDEPFASLDVHTRLRMGNELLDLWTSAPKTVLFVTHDLEEALALADVVVVLSAGPGSRVVSRHDVDLPRPRDLTAIRTEGRFVEVYREIWSVLREEVLRSYAAAS